MEDYLNKALPGAGYTEICATLDLDPESPVKDVLAAIEHLKHSTAKMRKHKEKTSRSFASLAAKQNDHHASD